jgi:hypothetical protein
MNIFKYIYNKFMSLFKVKKMSDPFKVPKVPRHSYHTGEVILYSYYLKTLGLDQTLNYGDWYYIQSEGRTLAKLYSKASFDYDDFTEFTKDEYIRMVTQEEALNILNIYGYNYANDTIPIVTAADGQTSVHFDNDDYKAGIVTLANSSHSAHLKAAYLVLCQSKALHDIGNAMKTSKFFNINTKDADESSDFSNGE